MKEAQKISVWLLTCAVTVLLMAVIGAITRLTESGLSIVEWNPVTGALPPLSADDWNHAFNLYKGSPQYQKVNLGMSLDDFKKIYFWEWLHRLWGRMIGVIYFLPLLWFCLKKQIPSSLQKPLLGLLILGLLQGVLGWLMVKSGLVDQPAVSHYRLAAHLALAMVIFCCFLRAALSLDQPSSPPFPFLRTSIKSVTVLVGITIIWGAFVAGLRAGLIYNTFPLMGENLWPGEILDMSPTWINFFENHATVQFIHRLLAALTFLCIIILVWKNFPQAQSTRLRKLLIGLGIAVCFQAALGITTLLTEVHIGAAALHQAGAFLLLTFLMMILHEIPKKA